MQRRLGLSRWLRTLFAPTRPIHNKPRPTVRPRLEQLEQRWLPAPMTFTVTDTSDADATSLRAAITASNGNNPGAGLFNTIDFNIGSVGSVQTINLLSGLPAITQPVDILGFSQGGNGYNGPPLIVLNGVNAGASANGLDFEAGSAGSEVQGLVIQQFGNDGILVNGTSGNLIVGNKIGTDVNGTANLGNSFDGVDIVSGATGNTVGGTATGAANVISGNRFEGVYLSGSGTSGNVVLGNKIGTDVNGTANLGNSGEGVDINHGATLNTVGGSATGAANVISANANCEPTTHRGAWKSIRPPPHHPPEWLREPTAAAWLGVG